MSFLKRTDKWWLLLVELVVAFLIIWPLGDARGQTYGSAKFYESHHWPRAGLKAHFVMDPGVRGNALVPDGDFETFSGASGGCTDCPVGWTCDCTTTGGDVTSETTHLYSRDKSTRLSATGALHSVVQHAADYQANTCYQVDFCYKGNAGTEDLQLFVGNAALTDTYAFATNTWTGAQTSLSLANIGTTWVCKSAFIRTGAVAKTSYVLAFAMETADGDYAYVDHVQFQELNVCDVTGSLGNVLTNPVTSDPRWGHSEKLLPRVGTGPAGDWGMGLDGTNDYLSCADADCEMDPVNWEGGGSFSVGCRAMTDTVSGVDYIISKTEVVGGQESWLLLRNSAYLAFYVSDDGTNTDSNSVTMFVADTLQSFVSTFDPSGGSGACENKLYYDAYRVDTDGTMTECVPFDSTASFHIGAYGSVAYNWDGSILECSLWETKLSPIESNKYINPYFPATRHGDGFYVDTCSQAASHAVCSSQVCRDGAPNTCQAEGTGVMALYAGFSEQLDNNSGETQTGGDDNPNFADWTEVESLGTGDKATITTYRADTFHGDAAIRFQYQSADTSFVPSGYVMAGAECVTTAKLDTYLSFKAKSLTDLSVSTGGTQGFYYYLTEYDAANCTTWLQQTTSTVHTDIPAGEWREFSMLHEAGDWHADTSSFQVVLVCNKTWNCDMILDAFSIKEASYRTPWVHNPSGAGTTSYTNRQYELHNPLSDYIEAEGKYGYEDGFCAAAWLYSDWAGDDNKSHLLMNVPGTAGNNNSWHAVKDNGDNIYVLVYDSVGNTRYYLSVATETNWSAGDWHYVEMCSNNTDNVLRGRHYNAANSTWYQWSSAGGAGTGIQDGQSIDLQVGHINNSGYLDGFISEIQLSPYSVVWPQKGFNSGKPPVNGNPY